MLNYKTQSVINITGLALGFAAFALAGYWYMWEHSFDTFHPEWGRTYTITTSGSFKTSTGEDGEINQLHESDAKILISLPFVEKSTRLWNVSWGAIKVGDKQERLYGYRIDSAFFSVFQSHFLEGNVYKIPYNNEYVVITRSAAMKLFGTIKCIGEALKQDNMSDLKVAAVIEDYPGNTELMFNILFLSSDDKTKNPRGRSICFVTLNSEKNKESFKEIVRNHKSVAIDPYGIDQPQQWKFNLRSLPELHFSCNHSLNERFRNIEILFWAGFLLLLCALMNNLALFLGQQQYKLKKNITYISLGANQINLFIRYLLCLMAPVLLGYVMALVILELFYPLFNDFTTIQSGANTLTAGNTRSMEFGTLLMESAKYTGVYLATYLLLALFPIIHFIRFSTGGSRNGSPALIRRILITGQIEKYT